MSSLRRTVLAPLLVAALVSTAGTGTGILASAAQSPEARLRGRIVDLRSEIDLLEVEWSAARYNLLEALKKVGQLEQGERKVILSGIKDDFRKMKMAGQAFPFVASGDVLKEIERKGEKSVKKEEREEIRNTVAFLKGGEEGEKALVRLAELELNGRLDSAQSSAETLRAAFVKTAHLMHQKKLELSEAEAEYKSTK
jgi:hypothetical protein